MAPRKHFTMVQEITPVAFERAMNKELARLDEEGFVVENVTFKVWQSDPEDTCGYEAFILYRWDK